MFLVKTCVFHLYISLYITCEKNIEENLAIYV